MPKFITLSETEGYMRVYATNSTLDQGSYEVVVTGTLNSLNIFSDPSSQIDASLRISKLNPPSWFIYQASFTVNLNVTAAPNSYVAPNNTAPYFVPTPTDIWFYAGDNFVKGFGPAYDNEGDAVTVKTDFGNAARFIFWDKLSNTITVPVNATNGADIGEYPLSISLTDNRATSVAFSGETFFGNVTYHFTLRIYRKIQV